MSGALCKRWSALGCLVVLVMSVAMVREARAQTGDDLYKKAAQEGIVNFYGTLAQINAEKILPVFEKRYPGVKVSQLDVTSDQLVTRATTEARAGKTLGDIFQAPLKTGHADARSEAALGSQFAGSERLPGRHEERRLGCVESSVHGRRLEYEFGQNPGRAETVRRLGRAQLEKQTNRRAKRHRVARRSRETQV